MKVKTLDEIISFAHPLMSKYARICIPCKAPKRGLLTYSTDIEYSFYYKYCEKHTDLTSNKVNSLQILSF